MESSSGQKARSHILIELLDTDDDVSQTRTQIVIQNDLRETDYVKNQRVKWVKKRENNGNLPTYFRHTKNNPFNINDL